MFAPAKGGSGRGRITPILEGVVPLPLIDTGMGCIQIPTKMIFLYNMRISSWFSAFVITLKSNPTLDRDWFPYPDEADREKNDMIYKSDLGTDDVIELSR